MNKQPLVSVGAVMNLGPLEAAEKAFAAEASDKNLIRLCYTRAIKEAESKDRYEDRKIALMRLSLGSVKRSKVAGVDSPNSVLDLIDELGSICMKKKHKDGRQVYRFPVPKIFKAVTPTATVKELKDLNIRYAIYPDSIMENGNETFKLRSPNTDPIACDHLTFILTPEADLLLEWFAGEDITLLPPTSDLGTLWVHLGTDRLTWRPHSHSSNNHPRYQPSR